LAGTATACTGTQRRTPCKSPTPTALPRYGGLMMSRIRSRVAVAVLTLALGLTGCATTFPADPEGTLDRVSGGTLRVGISPNGDWSEMTDDGEASGIEVDLGEDFARSIDADIAWVEGSEEHIMTQLEEGALDLVIGGFTDQSP